MIFNSYTFLLAFLPIVLVVFALIRRFAPRAAFGWLVIASLAFYGVWNPHPAEPWTPKYLLLIIGSCAGNYFIGRYLSGHKATRQNLLIRSVDNFQSSNECPLNNIGGSSVGSEGSKYH